MSGTDFGLAESLFLALAAILFNGVEPLGNFGKEA